MKLKFVKSKKKPEPTKELVQSKKHPFKDTIPKAEQLKDYNPVERGGFFTKFKNRWKAKREERCILISMELLNGMHKLFLVLEKDGGFLYRKKKYLLDNESKYWVIEAGMYAYDFHESFTLPIRRRIPVEKIRNDFEYDHEATDDEGKPMFDKEGNPLIIRADNSDIAYGTNPETLHQFEVAKIAEGIMRGADLQRFMIIILVITIITLVILVGFLILFMFKTGMFQAVKNAATGVTSTTLLG